MRAMWSVALAVVALGCAQVGKSPDVAGVKSAVRVVEKPVPVMPVQVRGANFELLPANDPAIVEAMKQLEETGGAPRIEREGFIYAPYDGGQTNIACKPTRICRIELAVGEVPKPNGVILGDSARWFAGVGSHGSGDRQVYSVFVKPTFTDSPDSTKCSHETNLIVQTDLRTYQFGLLCSDSAPYTRMLRFYYPDEVKVAWALGAAEIEQQGPRASTKSARDADADALPSVGATNFEGYTIGGAKVRWRPVRAFDDGSHMYLEMPSGVEAVEFPAFFVRGESGELELVNYRRLGKFVKVDRMFAELVLVVGEGRDRKEVTVKHKEG